MSISTSHKTRLVPVPYFSKDDVLWLRNELRKILTSSEVANRISDRLPTTDVTSALEQKTAWVPIADSKCEFIHNYYISWYRLCFTSTRVRARIGMYALLLDGFANELNFVRHATYPTRISSHFTCESPLSESLYSWSIGAGLLLDLPKDYGLDVNAYTHWHLNECALCRPPHHIHRRGGMSPLKWYLQCIDKQDLTLLDQLLSRCSDYTLNDAVHVTCDDARKTSLTLAMHMSSNKECISTFLKYARNDGSGISLSIKISFEQMQGNYLQYAERCYGQDNRPMIEEFLAAEKRIVNYQREFICIVNTVYYIRGLADIINAFSLRLFLGFSTV